MTIAERLLGTVLLRPYVFAFLAAFLALALPAWGWRRTVLYTVLGYCIAWAAEYSSVNNGFPFGHYAYLSESTARRELWVAGVPFMDSLSFPFLTFAGLQAARLLLQPIRRLGTSRCDWRWLEPARPVTAATWLLGGLLTMGLDIIIDPVTLQGARWFLGRIYFYPGGGPYFGVPLANFAGWALVSWAIIGLLPLADRALGKRLGAYRSCWADALAGAGLFTGVIAFNLAVTVAIGEWQMAAAGLAWATAMLTPLAAKLRRQRQPPQ